MYQFVWHMHKAGEARVRENLLAVQVHSYGYRTGKVQSGGPKCEQSNQNAHDHPSAHALHRSGQRVLVILSVDMVLDCTAYSMQGRWSYVATACSWAAKAAMYGLNGTCYPMIRTLFSAWDGKCEILDVSSAPVLSGDEIAEQCCAWTMARFTMCMWWLSMSLMVVC